jgi:hypothetical protein
MKFPLCYSDFPRVSLFHIPGEGKKAMKGKKRPPSLILPNLIHSLTDTTEACLFLSPCAFAPQSVIAIFPSPQDCSFLAFLIFTLFPSCHQILRGTPSLTTFESNAGSPGCICGLVVKETRGCCGYTCPCEVSPHNHPCQQKCSSSTQVLGSAVRSS